MKNSPFFWAPLVLGLATALANVGCASELSSPADSEEETGASAAALTAGTAPAIATITDGVGAAGAWLGMTQDEVAAKLGAPSSCTLASATTKQTCTYRSSDRVVRASATFDTASPRRLIVITIPFENRTWKTLKGIAVGSTAATFTAAYGSSIDAARSTYYSKAVPGIDANGQPSVTRFTLGWINEYLPNQYFGVVSITVGRI